MLAGIEPEPRRSGNHRPVIGAQRRARHEQLDACVGGPLLQGGPQPPVGEDPTSGGDYFFVSRSLGPAFGAISGIGIWLSLTFAISFYLFGLGEYLHGFLPISPLWGAVLGGIALTALNVIGAKESGSTQSKNPPLDGDAVRATVTANKPRLQRCYERAIRGQQSPPAVRLDVTVTVAPSGRVKAVSSEGNGPGGLAECIEASVRRWRFPASAEGGPAKFPIVFSAN